jgi:hypothetical protein
MVQLARSTFLAAVVCVTCLLASAFAFQNASLNRDTSASWHLTSLLTAVGVLVVAAFVARESGVLLLELAAAALAGGLLANSLVSVGAGGVADLIRAGGWLYSPGDLAVLGGAVLLAAGTALATARSLR